MTPLPRGTTVPRTPADIPASGVAVSYVPILDVARGVAAGYQVVERDGGAGATADVLAAALAVRSTLPTNTFLSIPVPLRLVDDRRVRRLLADHGDLGGVVLDVTDFTSEAVAPIEPVLDEYRQAGALFSVGGRDGAQPALGSIVRLRPAMIRLGGEWTRDLDRHPHRRTAIEVTGRLAGELDAWILAEGVTTSAELRVLADLRVPLARGAFIGGARAAWSGIDTGVLRVLPGGTTAADGVLRALVQQAYTTRDLGAAQSVLPEASGFETVVVVDDTARPVSLLEQDGPGRWEPVDVMTVNVDTPATDAVARAMARPRGVRLSPLVCTDAAGRFVGIVRIERLVEHLAAGDR